MKDVEISSLEEPKSSKDNINTCAWVAIVTTILFIICMALMVFLKVGISQKEDAHNDEPANIQIQGGSVFVPVHVYLPKKTCKSDTCGIDAICSEGLVRPKCACPSKYEGDPVTKCVKLECVENADCPSDQVCDVQHCINPCKYACAGQNAECNVLNHLPVCSCPTGYTGNPLFEDCTPAKEDNDYQTDGKNVTEGSAGTEDQSEYAPGEVRDVCHPSPCGPDANCTIFQNQALCNYFSKPDITFRHQPGSEYTTDPPSEQPGCESDDECDSRFACRDSKCVSPCSDCGENAICKKSDHRAVCECRRNYFGDPHIKCSPECEKDDDCPSTKPSCVDHACEDPCSVACGINADCRNRGKSTICSCPRHTTGDPLVFCKPDNQDDSVDFCDPDPCGANATCTVRGDIDWSGNMTNEYPVCTCPAGYVGNPRVACEVSECDDDSECQDDLACIEYQCADPCFDSGESVCGYRAECTSRRHLAICTCLEGTYGDPFTRCYSSGGGGGGGSGGLPSAVIASLLG